MTLCRGKIFSDFYPLLKFSSLLILLSLAGLACTSKAKDPATSSTTTTTTTVTDRGTLDVTASWAGAGNYTGYNATVLPASKVCSDKSIFGTTGTADCNGISLQSNACRDAGTIVIAQFLDGQTTSTQLSQNAEVTTYAGSGATPNLPTTGGYKYRDIPDVNKDDDGYTGITVKYAPRPGTICGTSGNITARIADCVTANGANATWDGGVKGSSGQSVWKLVTRAAANLEVWQDQRTGLLWSSQVGTAVNWCQASGNTQNASVTLYQLYNGAPGASTTGNGTIGSVTGGTLSQGENITIAFTSSTAFTVTSDAGAAGCEGGAITAGGLTGTAGSTVTFGRANYCSFILTQGATPFAANDTFLLQSVDAATYSCAPNAASGLQPASPISYCAEGAGFDQTGVPGENWGTGTYSDAKGQMGAASTDKVSWRLPTIQDYHLAEADGIRMVMPDMGVAGSSRPTPDVSTGLVAVDWSASSGSSNRSVAWYFSGDSGNFRFDVRNNAYGVRCVGR